MFCHLTNVVPFGLKDEYNNYWNSRFSKTGLSVDYWQKDGFSFDNEGFETVLILEELIKYYDKTRI